MSNYFTATYRVDMLQEFPVWYRLPGVGMPCNREVHQRTRNRPEPSPVTQPLPFSPEHPVGQPQERQLKAPGEHIQSEPLQSAALVYMFVKQRHSPFRSSSAPQSAPLAHQPVAGLFYQRFTRRAKIFLRIINRTTRTRHWERWHKGNEPLKKPLFLEKLHA